MPGNLALTPPRPRRNESVTTSAGAQRAAPPPLPLALPIAQLKVREGCRLLTALNLKFQLNLKVLLTTNLGSEEKLRKRSCDQSPAQRLKMMYQETNAISEATAIEEKEDRKGSEEGGVG
jgi:hypothetical protein